MAVTHGVVMAGPVPAIHDLLAKKESETWMPAT
jgi:hypothetical protein